MKQTCHIVDVEKQITVIVRISCESRLFLCRFYFIVDNKNVFEVENVVSVSLSRNERLYRMEYLSLAARVLNAYSSIPLFNLRFLFCVSPQFV